MTLFEYAAQQATRETRREALASVVDAMPDMQAEVYRCIRDHGPITCDAIEARLGMPHQTASARVHELMRDSRIVAAGKATTRSGRNAVAWRVA